MVADLLNFKQYIHVLLSKRGTSRNDPSLDELRSNSKINCSNSGIECPKILFLILSA